MTFCDEILEQVESIAAADVIPDEQTAAHLASCSGCAAALDTARRIDRLLQARPVEPAPAQFTTRTLARVRRDRWRQEQFFDLAFNVVVGVAIITSVAAAWFFLDLSGFSAVGQETAQMVSEQVVALARSIAPSVVGYMAAAGLLAMVLGIWWWAERDAGY